MSQLLLFPDPRPLVERLGVDFFRNAPEFPGVYLMRDVADTVLYVGKAKNLRKRLASYRVANPDRMRRRHLRLLRAVARIELQQCADEVSALSRESELLRTLRPRFNRAGTWKGPAKYFAWRIIDEGLEMLVTESIQAGWQCHASSLGAGANPLRAVLMRLVWCAVYPTRGFAGMPSGWFRGQFGERAVIPRASASQIEFDEVEKRLTALFDGEAEKFVEWVRAGVLTNGGFEQTSRDADLEAITEFAERL